MNCYQYQSAECDDWPQTWAYEVTEELRALALLLLPEALQALEKRPGWHDALPALYSHAAYERATWNIETPGPDPA